MSLMVSSSRAAVQAAVHVDRDVLDVVDGDADLVLDVAQPVHYLLKLAAVLPEPRGKGPAAFDRSLDPVGAPVAVAAGLAYGVETVVLVELFLGHPAGPDAAVAEQELLIAYSLHDVADAADQELELPRNQPELAEEVPELFDFLVGRLLAAAVLLYGAHGVVGELPELREHDEGKLRIGAAIVIIGRAIRVIICGIEIRIAVIVIRSVPGRSLFLAA